MTARARASYAADLMGVRIHVSPREGQLLSFGAIEVRTVDPAQRPDDNVSPLVLPDDIARAVYEALAEHFGHSGADTRALRRDYDAERKRVDTFIAHLTRGAQ